MSTQRKPGVFFKTFGCRTNQFDTQVMMANLRDFAVVHDESEADFVVINSCTVTNAADSSARNYINQVKKKSDAKIVFAGCGAISKGKELFEQNRVFSVFGHSQKQNLNAILKQSSPTFDLGDLKQIDDTVVEDFIGKSRAFIKIQEGCDFECSYCIIPSVRGAARSHKPQTILRQIEKLARNGYGEFILTGTNVGSFGKDIDYPLSLLLQNISRIKGVKRVRLGSLEPSQIDDAFMELLDEPWMAKHLHIALQHTSDEMLRIMRRRNRFEKDLALFERIADRGYALGTDFIAGHPGESEKLWQEAMQNAQMLPLTHIHCFTYSKRDNTASAAMKEEVRGDVAKARRAELVELIKAKNYDFRKRCTTPLQVLVESEKEGIFTGYDQYFNPLKIRSNKDLKHCWIEVDDVQREKNANFKTL